MIGSTTPTSPLDLQNALSDFEDGLRLVRTFTDGVNGMFALFDALVARIDPTARKSTLTIRATVDGNETSKVFLSL